MHWNEELLALDRRRKDLPALEAPLAAEVVELLNGLVPEADRPPVTSWAEPAVMFMHPFACEV